MEFDEYGTGIYEDLQGKAAQRRIWIAVAVAVALWFIAGQLSG
jgi:hypothetical protein